MKVFSSSSFPGVAEVQRLPRLHPEALKSVRTLGAWWKGSPGSLGALQFLQGPWFDTAAAVFSAEPKIISAQAEMKVVQLPAGPISSDPTYAVVVTDRNTVVTAVWVYAGFSDYGEPCVKLDELPASELTPEAGPDELAKAIHALACGQIVSAMGRYNLF